MRLSQYQEQAAKTDQVAGDDEKSIFVPLLGLAGEVGTLLSEYKKFLRDGSAHERFDEQVSEEIGDLLWYIANVATKFGLDLDQVAKENLEKTQCRWQVKNDSDQTELFDVNAIHHFDDSFPIDQQIPRQFEIKFTEIVEGKSIRVIVSRDGKQIGDTLTDNAHEDDGYRFHDLFHMSYAAVLGWSPVTRKLTGTKRKSSVAFDEVEDGARAGIIEELISQLVYTYARDHNYLEGVKSLDYHLLKTIQSLVADREVNVRSLADWETAIFTGYEVWRKLRDNRGGKVRINLDKRQIEFMN
ncbi:nucleoside triphosphate pyrophosphohydrolase family protein [Mariniblastus sp.]|nr:nucleoside triphosphate pyrophosphohydrolase family protein [Mariniblastus sp.]